jgi:hypothetical protein
MAPTHLPGAAWFRWLKHRPLRIGALTGIYLSAVMGVALFCANRIPSLEAYADLRNWICDSLFLLVALIPIATFWRAPWALFTCALSSWLLFSLSYGLAGMIFVNLQSRLNKTTFHMFMLGAGTYAVIAVFIWVWDMLTVAIAHGLTHPHHRTPSSARPNE